MITGSVAAALVIFGLLSPPFASRSRQIRVQAERLATPVDRWLATSLEPGGRSVAESGGKAVLVDSAGKRIELLTLDGPVQTVVVSPTRTAFATVTVASPASPQKAGRLRVRSFASDGTPLVTWTIDWEYDRPVPGFALTPDGRTLVVGRSDVAAVEILGNEVEMRRVELFPDNPEYAYERSLHLAVDPGRERILVLTVRRPARPPLQDSPGASGQPVLFTLRFTGEVEREEPLDADDVTGLRLIGYPRLRLLGLVQLPAPGEVVPFVIVRNIDTGAEFRVQPQSPDAVTLCNGGELVCLADPLRATAVRVADGTVAWRYTPDRPEESILQVSEVPGTSTCAVLTAIPEFKGTAFEYRDVRVRLLDPKGQTVDSAELPVTLPRRPLLAARRGSLDIVTPDHMIRITVGD